MKSCLAQEMLVDRIYSVISGRNVCHIPASMHMAVQQPCDLHYVDRTSETSVVKNFKSVHLQP